MDETTEEVRVDTKDSSEEMRKALAQEAVDQIFQNAISDFMNEQPNSNYFEDDDDDYVSLMNEPVEVSLHQEDDIKT